MLGCTHAALQMILARNGDVSPTRWGKGSLLADALASPSLPKMPAGPGCCPAVALASALAGCVLIRPSQADCWAPAEGAEEVCPAAAEAADAPKAGACDAPKPKLDTGFPSAVPCDAAAAAGCGCAF